MKNKDNAHKNEVYSVTGLPDLVSSPVFFSIVIISLLLGFASAFGFLQNPRKLKTVVDVISHKVFLSPYETKSRLVRQNSLRLMQKEGKFGLLNNQPSSQPQSGATLSLNDTSRYSIFAHPLNGESDILKSLDDYELSTHRYTLTANNFLGDSTVIRIQSIPAASDQPKLQMNPKTEVIQDSRLSKEYDRYSLSLKRDAS